jgi:hypothetical protein
MSAMAMAGAAVRIPSFTQVVDWAMLILDSHFASLLTLGDAQTAHALRRMMELCIAHVSFCHRADSLRGLLTQFVAQSTGRLTHPQPPISEYAIEVLHFAP